MKQVFLIFFVFGVYYTLYSQTDTMSVTKNGIHFSYGIKAGIGANTIYENKNTEKHKAFPYQYDFKYGITTFLGMTAIVHNRKIGLGSDFLVQYNGYKIESPIGATFVNEIKIPKKDWIDKEFIVSIPVYLQIKTSNDDGINIGIANSFLLKTNYANYFTAGSYPEELDDYFPVEFYKEYSKLVYDTDTYNFNLYLSVNTRKIYDFRFGLQFTRSFRPFRESGLKASGAGVEDYQLEYFNNILIFSVQYCIN